MNNNNLNNALLEETLQDPFYDFFYGSRYEKANQNALKTDVLQDENGTWFNIDVPGVKKSDMHVSLENGYLTVSVKNAKEEGKKYLRSERTYGTFTRSFYVGNDVKKEDVKASIKYGVLSLFVPNKKEDKSIEIC